jgi:hypothetical protein
VDSTGADATAAFFPCRIPSGARASPRLNTVTFLCVNGARRSCRRRRPRHQQGTRGDAREQNADQ